MTLYLDSSAWLKRYLNEPDSATFNAIIDADTRWVTSRITWVEVWRNLGTRLDLAGAREQRNVFRIDWRHVGVIEVDAALAESAGHLADVTRCKSLDAIHLAALQRAGPVGITLLTADLRQAQAARSLGWTVLGT